MEAGAAWRNRAGIGRSSRRSLADDLDPRWGGDVRPAQAPCWGVACGGGAYCGDRSCTRALRQRAQPRLTVQG